MHKLFFFSFFFRKISRTDSLLFSGAFDEWTGRCLWGVAPHAAGRVGVFSQHPSRSQPVSGKRKQILMCVCACVRGCGCVFVGVFVGV